MILAALTFTLASATFKPNGTMPMSTVYTRCGGANRSPELHWRGAPQTTRSFALIMHDPDAPHPDGWYHWIVYNLPASTTSLSQDATVAPEELGLTSFEQPGYGGPCPPAGKPHHYNFTLYALDETSVPGTNLTGPELKRAIQGHILAKTRVTGMFGRR